MEVFYRNDFDGYACYSPYQGDGFDAGPLFYREDLEMPGTYHMYQNPMWEAEKPQIILFSDFLNWYDPVDYKATLEWLLLNKEIGIGKPLRFPQSTVRYRVEEVKHHRTYLTRIDETTFCHDEIMIAKLTALCGQYAIPVKEWYRFRTIRSVYNDLNGELDVSIYRPSDNMRGWSLADYLAPDFRYTGLEDGAAEMLRTYYDKALRSPCRVDVYELADNMGYTVKEAFLSEGSRFRARVLFEESDINIFNSDKGIMETKTFKEKTILVDPAANHGRCYDTTEDSIEHECNHIFWHQPFQKMQSVHRQHMEFAGLSCDLETILHEEDEQEVLRTIERQARALTPRVRMPAAQTALLTQQYQQANDQRYCNHGMAVEKTIGQVARFFGTSKEATRNRQKELGNTEVSGILVHCNGGYLPRHSWSTHLNFGESYSVESGALENLRKRNQVLNALMSYEVFVYADGFVCMNDPQYVTNGKCGRHMTPGALKDVSKCCLKFTVHNDRDDCEFTYGVLNSIDKRGMEHIEFDVSSAASIMEEVRAIRGIRKNLPDEFLETLEGYISEMEISKNQLAAVTTIDEDRLSNIRRNKVKNIRLEEVVALGLGLGLVPEEIDDLVEKSPTKFDRSERSVLIRVLTRKFYNCPVTTFNDAMLACGQEPLTYPA